MKIVKLLNSYKPYDEDEESTKLRMLEFIQNYSNIYSRKQQYGHFTASAFILNKSMDKFLLIHHKKLNMWMQVGGHCDEDENIDMVAMREAKEESGIRELSFFSENIFDLDIHIIPKINDEAEHYHFDVRFLLKSNDDDSLLHNEEVLNAKWISFFEDYSEYKLGYSVIKMIEKYKNQYLL